MKRVTSLGLVCGLGLGCGSSDGEPPAPGTAAGAGEVRAGASVEADDRGAPPGTKELLTDETEPVPEHEGLTRLREAVDATPMDPQAHRRLGVALRRAGRTEEALGHLRRAVELAPEAPGVLLSLGIAYSEAGRLDEAKTTYARINPAAPDYPKALSNLGNIALRQGSPEGAIDFYRKAAEADPSYILARHKLAGVLKYYGRVDEAYPIYEAINAMTPSTSEEQGLVVDSVYQMGSINLARGEVDLAEQQLTLVVRAAPLHRSAHYARAQALIVLGRQEEAERELDAHVQVLHASGQGF